MKPFKELTIQEQKIKIVEDAIIQIKQGKLLINTGTYLTLIEDNDDADKIKSLQKTILSESITCECCAKGALFVSCVINTNKVNRSDWYSDEGFQKNKLKKWFKPLELDMIETAFEKRVISDSTKQLESIKDEVYYHQTPLAEKCIKFCEKYKTDEQRLLAILNNIIKNGEFKP